jgi:hypothetical protein
MKTITVNNGQKILVFRQVISVCEFDLIVTALLLLKAGKSLSCRKQLIKKTLRLIEHKGIDFFSRIICQNGNGNNWTEAKYLVTGLFPEFSASTNQAFIDGENLINE